MHDYLGNLLGATALAVTDRVVALAEGAVGLTGQGPGALVLVGMAPRSSIKKLAQRLKLSHAGTVRLVDRLEGEGFVQRETAADRREVLLTLTRKGHAAVERLTRARRDVLNDLVADFSAKQRSALEPLLAHLLCRLTTDTAAAYGNCRLCDAQMCAEKGCPLWAEAEGEE